MNNYFEFQVNIFNNNRDIRKCPSFRTTPDDDDDTTDDDARAMTIPRRFFENSQAKNDKIQEFRGKLSPDCKNILSGYSTFLILAFKS